MLEIERKLHILTPLLWPSHCVFLNLLILNRGHGVHSAGCWLPLLHLISIFSGPQLIRASSPFGRVGLSLPHLVSNFLGSAGNCIGGFREPPRSGVAFLTTSRLYCLEFYWQLLRDPNSTELNNNSTPTWSPTGSLKSNV